MNPPPRTTIGTSEYPYCRVLGGVYHVGARYPCYESPTLLIDKQLQERPISSESLGPWGFPVKNWKGVFAPPSPFFKNV